MDAAIFSCHSSIKEASELAAKAAVAFFALLLLLHLTSELARITFDLLLGMLHLVTALLAGAPLLFAKLPDLPLASAVSSFLAPLRVRVSDNTLRSLKRVGCMSNPA